MARPNRYRSCVAAAKAALVITQITLLVSKSSSNNCMCYAFVPANSAVFIGNDARRGPVFRHQTNARSYSALFSTAVSTNDSATKTSNKPISSYSRSEVAQAQADAERHARSIHDTSRNHAMNALFVNVPEQPTPTPCTIAAESVTQNLPKDLPPGCILRIGPNGATPEMGFLDGDGMVHCITIPTPCDESNNGEIMYSATYVDTKGRKLERARRIKTAADDTANNGVTNGATYAGTLGAAPQGLPMLYSLLRNGLTFGTLDVQKDTCNTALAASGSRVLALMEQSPPTEIEITKRGEMRTVQSMCRLDGAVPTAPINGGSLGAHGRTDPITGERVHVSYTSADRPYVRVDTFGKDWKLKSTVGVDVPAPVMVHDCALTENYVVIMDFPLTIRPRRFLSNSFPVEYEPENGTRIGLTKRSGGGEDNTLWVDVEDGVVLHAANAYERDDGTVVLHAFKSVPSGSQSFILDYTPAFLYEWIIDTKEGRLVNERCLNPNVMVEFPQLEDSLVGKEAAHAYALVSTSIGGPLVQFKTPNKAVLLDSFVKLALEDDEITGLVAGDVVGKFDLPTGWHSVSEPSVVTKTGNDGHYVLLIATFVPPSDDKNGSEGRHVEVATDGQSMKSQLLVFDGDCISDGPVTTVNIPFHINYGLHSLFLDWEHMK